MRPFIFSYVCSYFGIAQQVFHLLNKCLYSWNIAIINGTSWHTFNIYREPTWINQYSIFRCLNWTQEFTMHISTFHYKLPPHRNLALESPCHSAVTSSTLYSQQGLTDRSMLFLPRRNTSPFGAPSYCLPLQIWEEWEQLLLYWCACSLPPIGSVYWDSPSQLKN